MNNPETIVAPGPYKIVAATGIGVFLSALDSSIVNVSLSTMKENFQVGFEVQWIVIAYLLIFTSAMPLMGKFGDRFGKERIFQIGMVVFIVGSFFCALSSSLIILIVSRMFQAIGASMMSANGLALVTYFTTPENRGRAIGMSSILLAGALASGPVLGGFLSEAFGWPSIFLVNLPIGVIGLVIFNRLVPCTERVVEVKFDSIGAILFFGFLFLFVYGISIISSISSIELMLFMIWTFAILLFFIVRERDFETPIIPTSVLGDRRIATSIFSALFSYMAIVPVTFLIPQYLQEALEFSPLIVGFILTTHPIIMFVLGPIAGFISERVQARYQTTIGLVFQLIGLSVIGAALPNIIFMIIGIAIMAVGLALFGVANGNFIMTSAPKRYMGVVSALINISRTTGFSVATAAIVSVFSLFFTVLNPLGLIEGPGFVDAYTQSLQWGIWTFCILTVIAILISATRGLSPSEGGVDIQIESLTKEPITQTHLLMIEPCGESLDDPSS